MDILSNAYISESISDIDYLTKIISFYSIFENTSQNLITLDSEVQGLENNDETSTFKSRISSEIFVCYCFFE